MLLQHSAGLRELLHALAGLGDRTRVESEWMFHPDAFAHPGFNPQDAIEFWDVTNRQDWRIIEESQPGSSRAATSRDRILRGRAFRRRGTGRTWDSMGRRAPEEKA